LEEVEGSKYNFELANVKMLLQLFQFFEKESENLLKAGLVLPGYEYCLKCSHIFNLLDARGAISVAEGTQYIARVRHLAHMSAEKYLEQRKGLGYPLLTGC